MGASLAWSPPSLLAGRPVHLLLPVRPRRSPWRASLRSPRWRRTGPASLGPHSIPSSSSPYPRREQGPPWHSPWAAVRRAEGASCVPGVMLVEGDYFLPRNSWNQEGKQRWRMGSSCRVIQARFRLPRAFHGPLLGSRKQVTREKPDWAVPCTHRLDVKGITIANLASVYCAGSSLGGRPHGPQPRPGDRRSRPAGKGTELGGRESLPPEESGAVRPLS